MPSAFRCLAVSSALEHPWYQRDTVVLSPVGIWGWEVIAMRYGETESWVKNCDV
jgi:lambda repressor-like predicted transcriptional regulator